MNQTVIAGDTVVFNCTAWADPPHTTIWTFDGQSITQGGSYTISSDGTLMVTAVTITDTGVYACNVSNKHGWDYSNATLTVQG